MYAKYYNVCSSAFPHLMDPIESKGGQEYIFFTRNTYQVTFINKILFYHCRNWKCDWMDGQTDVKVEIIM